MLNRKVISAIFAVLLFAIGVRSQPLRSSISFAGLDSSARIQSEAITKKVYPRLHLLTVSALSLALAYDRYTASDEYRKLAGHYEMLDSRSTAKPNLPARESYERLSSKAKDVGLVFVLLGVAIGGFAFDSETILIQPQRVSISIPIDGSDNSSP